MMQANRPWVVFCAMGPLIVSLSSVRPHAAFGDASATADSRNLFFNKYADADGTDTTYYSSANALKGTYSENAQATNEGGTTGLLSFGPDNKFANNGGSPGGKIWHVLHASVPSPGTTQADGLVKGSAYIDAGTLYDTYEAGGLAGGIVKQSTIPSGGFGMAYGKLADPTVFTAPVFNGAPITLTNNAGSKTFTPSGTPDFEIHAFVDMAGSSLTFDQGGGGSMEWSASIDGISGGSTFTTLFDYQFSTGNGLHFSSTLTAAPGVSFYLNDYSTSTPSGDYVTVPSPPYASVPTKYVPDAFDPGALLSAGQLQTYLDSFALAGDSGWSVGGNDVLIGIDYQIPNSALGNPSDNPGDTSNRYFDFESDVSAAANESAVPEPACTGMMVMAGLGILRQRRRASPIRSNS